MGRRRPIRPTPRSLAPYARGGSGNVAWSYLSAGAVLGTLAYYISSAGHERLTKPKLVGGSSANMRKISFLLFDFPCISLFAA